MARIPRNVRNLNPGNLMPPTEAEGYDWWPGYAGSDQGGFAQFEDAESGINALLQQIRIDKGRKLTLRKFIEKYVGKTADPEGTANALRNIPQILGARLDTLLTEIPSDSLARAITQSEGGAAAADTFKIPSTEEEIDEETLAQALRGPASDVEKEPFIGPRQRDLGPSLPLLPLKNVFEVAAEEPVVDVATGGSGDRARGKATQYAQGYELNQANWDSLSEDEKQEIRKNQFRGSGDRARGKATQYTQGYELNQANWDLLSEDEKQEIRNNQFKGKQRDVRDKPTSYQIDAENRGHLAALFTKAPEVPVGPFGGQPITFDKSQGAYRAPRKEVPVGPFGGQPITFDKSQGAYRAPRKEVVPADAPAAAEAGPSFLSRLGGAIKDNPMIASQIAQVVGGIGSGVLGGRRMAKEQAKGARRQREAMNMANAISTLTRGRTQPAVAPRPVISKPGGAETIFDILGTLGQGGAQITQGVQQREEAAEDRRRQQEMEDFRKEYLTRGQDIEELKVEGEMRAQQQAAQIERLKSIKPMASKDFNPLKPGEGDFIRTTLNELKALHAEGDFGTTGYFSWDRKWLGPAKLQNEFDGKRNMLINNMRKVMGLGRLTKEDLALVLDTLPEVGDTRWELQGKIDGIVGIIDRLEQRSTGVLGLGAGAFAGAGGDYANMSRSELADYLDENTDDGEFTGDPKALAEFNERSPE